MTSKGHFATYMHMRKLLPNFGDGLNYFRFVQVIKENPSVLRPLFATDKTLPLRADAFLSLMELPFWQLSRCIVYRVLTYRMYR